MRCGELLNKQAETLTGEKKAKNCPEIAAFRLIGSTSTERRKHLLKEDIERLEREANIFRAKQGPGWTWVDDSIAINKAKARELANMQAEYNAKSRIPVNNEGAFEDVSRRAAITCEHKQRERYARSKPRSLVQEK
jgi:hypothetical protein